ncbi:MAG: alpha/beta fold hydrolase [Bdellovibrionales bacterium]|nr:alpha/beta fold hydrolase [Bdellovibrionales bacterium]
MILLALHGFFGRPQDWDFLRAAQANGQLPASLKIVTPDLSDWALNSEVVDFTSFAQRMNDYARSLGPKVTIAGYSLGGRLAASCVVTALDSDLYRGFLMISANPGLSEDDGEPAVRARRERFEHDCRWSERIGARSSEGGPGIGPDIRTDTWVDIWADWNKQAVLKPGARDVANKKSEAGGELSSWNEERREARARAMRIWSLGKQPDYREVLNAWGKNGRLQVLTGSEDTKFTELTLNWLQGDRHRPVLGAGHRILNEAPEDVVSQLSMLLSGPQTC